MLCMSFLPSFLLSWIHEYVLLLARCLLVGYFGMSFSEHLQKVFAHRTCQFLRPSTERHERMSLARNGSQFGDQQSEKGYYFCVIILYDCGFSLIWFYFFISHLSQPPPPPLPQCNWHPANHFSSFWFLVPNFAPQPSPMWGECEAWFGAKRPHGFSPERQE